VNPALAGRHLLSRGRYRRLDDSGEVRLYAHMATPFSPQSNAIANFGDCKLVATRNASEISSSAFFFGPDLPRFLVFHLKISSKCLRE
jgi:hypothetical protein